MLLFSTTKNEFLTLDLKFSKDQSKAALFLEERVGKYLTRFRCLQNNKYIGCLDGEAFKVCEKEDDSSLFLLKANDNHLLFETIQGNPLLNFRFQPFAQPHFTDHGFFVLQNVFPPKLVEIAKNKILERREESRISDLFALDKETFVSILQEGGYLKSLLKVFFENDDFHLTTYSSNTLFGNNINIDACFHVDYPYHTSLSISQQKEKILGIQVIIPLTDFNLENGATLFIPKSFANYGNGVNERNICFFSAPQGSIIFYRADLVHSQGCNKTKIPRIALLANFAPLCIPAKDSVALQAQASGLILRDGKVFI